MKYTYRRVNVDDLSIGDIIYVDIKVENALGLNNVMLLTKVLSIKRVTNKIEVVFLSSDSSTIWFSLGDCYYIANKQN